MVSDKLKAEIGQALEDYMDSRKATKSTKEKYRRAFRKVSIMLDFSPDSIRAFLASLRREGQERSMRFYYFFMKSLVKNVLGGEWKLGRTDIPPEPEELNRPILKAEQINDMIMKLKKRAERYPLGTDLTRFAISTVYGARRIELAELDKDSINLEEKVLRIRTRKHGEFRTHILADEIIPYLRPERLRPVSVGRMSTIFNTMAKFCRMKLALGYGWHSIRRRLATYFDDCRVSEKDIFTFMRWRRRKTILDRYIVRTPLETETTRAQVDMEMFKIHPFLPIWRA